MKRLVMTMALGCVLSASALAGDIPTSDSPAPAPSGTPQGISSTAAGQTPSALGDIPTGQSMRPMLDSALTAFLSVLGLVV